MQLPRMNLKGNWSRARPSDVKCWKQSNAF